MESWNVLVVGNNPIELSQVYERLRGIPERNVLTEIAFNLRTLAASLLKFRPQHIVIDDNIGQEELKTILSTLLQEPDTSRVPVTVLKNSNYYELVGTGIMNYVLKQNLTSDKLYHELLNSQRYVETQQTLAEAYRLRKEAW